ncbi:MerR family transcriptional regulator [Ruminococcus sp. AM42-11]|uniref:MerR family transcriptional regulator n=1 Tax=Ruminococcus sp. AM42-11 TaxID=2292372 RepID=UPI00267B204F
MYTIGQVSAMFNLPVSTLRYYDKEGFFPNLERKGNIRYFSDNELEALRIIECLKKSGLEIKDIKQFFIWVSEAAPVMKKGKNYLKPENQLLKLKFRNSKKLFPS